MDTTEQLTARVLTDHPGLAGYVEIDVSDGIVKVAVVVDGHRSARAWDAVGIDAGRCADQCAVSAYLAIASCRARITESGTKPPSWGSVADSVSYRAWGQWPAIEWRAGPVVVHSVTLGADMIAGPIDIAVDWDDVVRILDDAPKGVSVAYALHSAA